MKKSGGGGWLIFSARFSFCESCAGRRERASPSHPSKSRIMPPYFGLFGRRSSEMLICEARYYSYRRALVVANVYVRRSSSNLRLLRLENPLFWTKNWWETFRVDFFRPFFAGQYLSPKLHISPQMGISGLIKKSLSRKSEHRELRSNADNLSFGCIGASLLGKSVRAILN